MTEGKKVAWRTILSLQCILPEASEAIVPSTPPLADLLALHGVSQDFVRTRPHFSPMHVLVLLTVDLS